MTKTANNKISKKIIDQVNEVYKEKNPSTYKKDFDKKKIEWLEEKIDHLNRGLPDLDNFILPGGHKDSSKTHIARTVCRRAERSLVLTSENESINKSCIIYINRLSDLLFVLARKINIDSDEGEILWDQT